jgi:hypothetical protein
VQKESQIVVVDRFSVIDRCGQSLPGISGSQLQHFLCHHPQGTIELCDMKLLS